MTHFADMDLCCVLRGRLHKLPLTARQAIRRKAEISIDPRKELYEKLALEYGVSPCTIQRIIQGYSRAKAQPYSPIKPLTWHKT